MSSGESVWRAPFGKRTDLCFDDARNIRWAVPGSRARWRAPERSPRGFEQVVARIPTRASSLDRSGGPSEPVPDALDSTRHVQGRGPGGGGAPQPSPGLGPVGAVRSSCPTEAPGSGMRRRDPPVGCSSPVVPGPLRLADLGPAGRRGPPRGPRVPVGSLRPPGRGRRSRRTVRGGGTPPHRATTGGSRSGRTPRGVRP